ncbi:MAG: hypothetical protein LIP02_11480 [Bacteroidales bacterium]|nr:hypothetical protein [Bacteroidales bacterium]
MIDQSLKAYIEGSVLPLYDGFDPAHRRDHADMVIEQSLAALRAIIRDLPLLRSKFDTLYNKLT